MVRGKEGDPERFVREVSSFLQIGFRQVEWRGEGRMDDLKNLEKEQTHSLQGPEARERVEP